MIDALKGNFAIFYMLAKYVPGDIKYIFFKLQSSKRFKWSEFNISDPDFKFQSHNAFLV
jgi:hypothetical protein